MGRWAPDARGRLQHAAIELFVEHGYAETTVPQIAERAGLTNRTFYRYFGDKQEVLFAPENEFPERVSAIVETAPRDDGPWAAVRHGMETAARTLFPDSRDDMRTRWEVIQSDPSLIERELAKHADLAVAMRDGFATLGYDHLVAATAAELSVAAMRVALENWMQSDGDDTFTDHMHEALDTVERIIAPTR